jgi:hypothetical protein
MSKDVDAKAADALSDIATDPPAIFFSVISSWFGKSLMSIPFSSQYVKKSRYLFLCRPIMPSIASTVAAALFPAGSVEAAKTRCLGFKLSFPVKLH